MRYKHIIFDIDGTMLNSAYAVLTALQRVIRELQGKDYELHELHFALGIPGEITFTQLGIKDVVKANLLWNDYMKEAAHTMRIFDGIRELIIELKGKGVKLGIITSKNRKEFRNDFTPFGLDSYFDTIIIYTLFCYIIENIINENYNDVLVSTFQCYYTVHLPNRGWGQCPSLPNFRFNIAIGLPRDCYPSHLTPFQ